MSQFSNYEGEESPVEDREFELGGGSGAVLRTSLAQIQGKDCSAPQPGAACGEF
jgi:hypothetical protein